MKLSLLNMYIRLEKYSDLDLDGRIQSYAKLFVVNVVDPRIHLNDFGLMYVGVDANQYDRDVVIQYCSETNGKLLKAIKWAHEKWLHSFS